MSTSATDTFLDDLKGVSKGKKNQIEIKPDSTLEKLLDARETYEIDTFPLPTRSIQEDISKQTKKLSQYLEKEEIDYSETDIVDLVNYANIQDYTHDESQRTGVYIGALITLLTKENEVQDKRTIIEIPENYLNYLGYGCEKFDVIKLGVDFGNYVFNYMNEGKLLYVDRCEGYWFANCAGSHEGKVDHIIANTVNGDGFAQWAGGSKGKVDHIIANTVNGTCFAFVAGSVKGKINHILANTVNGHGFAGGAGSNEGKVNYIIANEVNGEGFARLAGMDNGKVDYILANTVNGDDFTKNAEGKILKNSQQATELYGQKIAEVKKVLAEHGIDWGEEL